MNNASCVNSGWLHRPKRVHPAPYRTGHPGNVRQEVGTMDAARDEGVRSRAPHRSGAWGPRRLLGGLGRELPPGAKRAPGIRRPGNGAWIAAPAYNARLAVVLRGPTL